MPAWLVYSMVGAALLVFLCGFIQQLLKNRDRPRCPECGYLLNGPLHDKKRCKAKRKVRNLSDDEMRTRRIHRINEDEFGF